MTRVADRPRISATAVAAALFAGEQTVAGEIVRTTLGTGAEWADEVLATLEPGERALASLSFAPSGISVAQRTVPHDVAPVAAGPVPAATHQVTERPSAAEYADNVRTALRLIDDGRVQKVVLGRGLDIVSDPPLDPGDVVARLLAARPGRYVFGVPLTAASPGPVLVGASPELLIRRQGAQLSSLPLAGSIPRSPDPAEDRRRAAGLLDSAKDLAEHAFVVDAIVGTLAPLCVDLTADARPRLVSTDTLHHLGTQIRATLAPGARGASALHLAQLLQPTPAVGGVPVGPALEIIARLEEDRGPLTGAVGWVDSAGDGEFAVTIRAGVLHGHRLRLYAGAGIVAGSVPDAEVRETGAKLRTMRTAVGL